MLNVNNKIPQFEYSVTFSVLLQYGWRNQGVWGILSPTFGARRFRGYNENDLPGALSVLLRQTIFWGLLTLFSKSERSSTSLTLVNTQCIRVKSEGTKSFCSDFIHRWNVKLTPSLIHNITGLWYVYYCDNQTANFSVFNNHICLLVLPHLKKSGYIFLAAYARESCLYTPLLNSRRRPSQYGYSTPILVHFLNASVFFFNFKPC